MAYMGEKDQQAKPLAPAGYNLRSDDHHHREEKPMSKELKLHHHHWKYIKLCGCVTALGLILSVILLALVFTLLHIRDPVIKVNGIHMLGAGGAVTLSAANLTLIADVSVKNPNVAFFKFGNATTAITYNGTTIGEARTPPGKVKAKRTIRMNVTAEIIPVKLTEASGPWAINVSSYTRIGLRVKILSMMKKHVVLKMNCIITVNVTSLIIAHSCKPHHGI